MFKLQRPINSNRPSKPRPDESFDFKFSNFQALQVPKGWDRLFLSMVHVETGKTIARFGKSLVRNGTCQWTETLSESIYYTKGCEECLVKLIISTGSTKSTTLGELTINLANCATSRVSAAISQPLKKCSYGTILQLKIQCLTPRSKPGDEDSKIFYFHEKDRNVHNHDPDSKSFFSDNSSDSKDGPPKETSQLDFHSFDNVSSPNHSSLDDERYLREDYRNEEAVNRRSISSSKHLLEASEHSVNELRAEAKMWERNARKLMSDLDLSRNEFSELSKSQLELKMELSAAHAENENLKLELDKSTKNQPTQDFIAQSENLIEIQRVLENEMKYQQELIDNLGHQLKRSQESNIELVSVLQDLEQTIEQQRAEKSAKEEEIASLEATLSGYIKLKNSEAFDDDNEIESLRQKIEELEKDCAELTDENLELLLKLKDLNKNNTNISKCASFDSSDGSEVSDPKFQISADTEERKKTELEEENIRLLENQVRQLKDENELCLRKIEDMQEKLLLSQEECEYMEKENTALHVSSLEASNEIQDLTGQLDSSRKNHEKTMAENEKVLKMLENYKRIEENLKSELNELESKHANEMGVLKAQIQNMSGLQDEILILKSELEGCEDDKGKLELALETVTSDYEETKAENILLLEKISSLQDALSEFDECKQNKLVVEEKLLQMETAKKTICVQNEELKNELSEMNKENMQYRNKIHGLKGEVKLLEKDNIHKEGANILLSEKISALQDALSEFDECKQNKLVVEEKLLQMETAKETICVQNKELKNKLSEINKQNVQFRNKIHGLEGEVKLLEKDNIHKEGANILLSEKISALQDALCEFDECKQNRLVVEEKLLQMKTAKETICVQNEKLKNELNEINKENMQFRNKIHVLEEEVKLLKERDNIHKEGAKNRRSLENESNKNRVVHERHTSAGQKNSVVSTKKSSNEVVVRERHERTKSSLEAELKELRERYLEISLKYAEVESEREDLVMKLRERESKGVKRWFS